MKAIARMLLLISLVIGGCSSAAVNSNVVQCRAELVGYEATQERWTTNDGRTFSFDRVKLRLLDPPEWQGRELAVLHEIHFRTEINWLKVGQHLTFKIDPETLKKAMDGTERIATSELEDLIAATNSNEWAKFLARSY